MPAMIRLVTGRCLDRLRGSCAEGPISLTNRVRAPAKYRPLGRTAPVVWKFQEFPKNSACSVTRRRMQRILPDSARQCYSVRLARILGIYWIWIQPANTTRSG